MTKVGRSAGVILDPALKKYKKYIFYINIYTYAVGASNTQWVIYYNHKGVGGLRRLAHAKPYMKL